MGRLEGILGRETGEADALAGLQMKIGGARLRRAVAMICKTGGGTLLDSLWSATPIITLEPFGAHEAVNAELWRRLGFGTTFAAWRDGGFRLRVFSRSR